GERSVNEKRFGLFSPSEAIAFFLMIFAVYLWSYHVHGAIFAWLNELGPSRSWLRRDGTRLSPDETWAFALLLQATMTVGALFLFLFLRRMLGGGPRGAITNDREVAAFIATFVIRFSIIATVFPRISVVLVKNGFGTGWTLAAIALNVVLSILV